jgi:hypothetical protein
LGSYHRWLESNQSRNLAKTANSPKEMTSFGWHTVLARLLQTLPRSITKLTSRIRARQEFDAFSMHTVLLRELIEGLHFFLQRNETSAQKLCFVSFRTKAAARSLLLLVPGRRPSTKPKYLHMGAGFSPGG